MTNLERVQAMHTDWVIAKSEKPGTPHELDSIHWPTAEAIAEKLDIELRGEPEDCPIADQETGGAYYCTRPKGHEGPCVAQPKLL